MAAFTCSAFSTGMHIPGLMAAKTGGGSVIKLVGGGMAFGADHATVRADQIEDVGMVECRGLPGGRCVAVFAGGAFITSMHIFRLMATDAGCGRALVFVVDMALGA